jgi:hypothetical protein
MSEPLSETAGDAALPDHSSASPPPLSELPGLAVPGVGPVSGVDPHEAAAHAPAAAKATVRAVCTRLQTALVPRPVGDFRGEERWNWTLVPVAR